MGFSMSLSSFCVTLFTSSVAMIVRHIRCHYKIERVQMQNTRTTNSFVTVQTVCMNEKKNRNEKIPIKCNGIIYFPEWKMERAQTDSYTYLLHFFFFNYYYEYRSIPCHFSFFHRFFFLVDIFFSFVTMLKFQFKLHQLLDHFISSMRARLVTHMFSFCRHLNESEHHIIESFQ